MGKSGGKQQVVDYRMAIHFGVSLSADEILGIYVNEKTAWEGESSVLEALSINEPNLFGGSKQQGGLVGTVYHLPGRADQKMPEELAQIFGETSDTSVAYRGLTSLFFVGASASEGFLWSSNYPVVAQTVAVKVRRRSVGLSPELAMIGSFESNPAHIIYECLTNKGFGMGDSPYSIDAPSFEAAATTLFAEEFGLSIKWMRQTTIETFIGEILDHIQGMLFLSPTTGLWTLKLLRDDYDIEDLEVISPENANLADFKQSMWGEHANEMAVSWTNPLNEEDETVTVQDLGAIAAEGQIIQSSRNYYGVRNERLAIALAARDVRSSTAPISTATAEMDRRAWSVKPGDVKILNWPEQNVYGVVCRVMGVDYGRPGDSTIKLSLMQDIFSLEKTPIATVPGTGWTDPSQPPEPLAASEIITLPAYFTTSSDFQVQTEDLVYPEVLAAVLAYQDDTGTNSFELMSLDVTPSGDEMYMDHGSKSLTERILLPVIFDQEVTTRLPEEWISRPSRGPQINGFVFFGALHDYAMEIAQVVGFDDIEGEWILARGVLDTVPSYWPVGTPTWFVNPGARIVDSIIRSAGEEVSFKLLSRTGLGLLPIADAPVLLETLNGRPHLPLRPANVKINGTAFGAVDMSAADTMALTWATRNRLLEDGQVLRWDTISVPPEYAQETVIKVFDDGGALLWEQRTLWTEAGYDIPKAWFARWSSIHVYVLAARDNLASLQNFGLHVTGLPGDAGAAGPPDPIDFGLPPSPDPAPETGAWSVTGSLLSAATGAQQPAIVVAGQRDRSDAVGLIVRYRKDGTTDWFYLTESALNDAPTQVATTAVAPRTKYDVEIAYHSARNILSLWRSLGDVTTGTLIADNTENVGDLTALQVKEAIDAMLHYIADLAIDEADVEAAIAAARVDLLAYLTGSGFDPDAIAQAMIERATAQRDLEEFVQARTLIDHAPIGGIVLSEQVRTDDLVSFRDLMGVKSEDGEAWLLNEGTVKFANGEFLVAKVFGLSATLDDVQATLSTNYYTIAAANAAIAAADIALLATINGNMASALASYYTRAEADSAIATANTSLLTTVNGNIASAVSGLVTASTLDSSIATYDLSIKSWANTNIANPLASSISIQGTAISTLEGNAYGKLMLQANANGNVASMSLLASTGATNISAIIFEAASFQIRSGTAATITPLTYDALTGTLFLQNITVRNANIESAAITELKVANGALYNRGYAVSTNGVSLAPGAAATVQTVTMTTSGGKCQVQVSIYIHPIYAAPGALTAREVVGLTVLVYRNGSLISDLAGVQALRLELVGGDKYCSTGHWMNFSVPDQPSAGSNSWYVIATGGDVDTVIDFRSVTVEEMKRS